MDIDKYWRRTFRIKLETPRLLLRPLIPKDTPWLADLYTDPEVTQFLWETLDTPERALRAAQAVIDLDLMKSRMGHWAIQDKATRQVHGWTELSKLRPWSGPSDEIALSYVLRRASWGQGIATEAAGRLLKYAFELHELERVMAITFVKNTASKRVLEKLGMRPTKRRRAHDGRMLQYFQIDAPKQT